ncbi:MAG: hypothetical protein IJW19_05325 [Clostridia bacterium]|nr:hypothetical protein [Clostridia bacterium]
MRKTYRVFRYFFPAMIGAFALVSIIGAVAFSTAYDTEALTLDFGSSIVSIFMISIALTFIASVVLSVFVRKLHFERIKKHTRLTSFCGFFASITGLGAFVQEIVYIVGNNRAFTILGIVRLILTLAVCAYFAIEALPRFINRKWVIIPAYIRQALSASSIIWAVLGIFDVYFSPADGLLTTSFLYNGKIIAYTAIAMFFIFEGVREFTKPKYGMLVFSALFTSLITFALSASMILALIVGGIKENYLGFTLFDHFFTIGIGLFSMSRVYSILKTLRLTILSGEYEPISKA